MKLIEVFTLLVLFLIASFSFGDRINHSKGACQKKIFDACTRARCHCSMKHYHSQHPELNKKITWSMFEMKCDSIENLRAFVAIGGKCMLYEPDHGSDEYGETEEQVWYPIEVNEIIKEKMNAKLGIIDSESDIQRRSFAEFILKISDDSVRDVRTGCGDTTKVRCLNTGGRKDLEWVTRLEVTGRRIRSFGTGDEPVLHLFPNLRVLTLSPRTKTFKVALTELPFLQHFYINAQKSVVKLYCAYRGDKCLTNPEGLKRLELRFDEPQTGNRKCGFELYGKLKLPKVIDTLTINTNDRDNQKRSMIAEDLNQDDNDAAFDDDYEVKMLAAEHQILGGVKKRDEVIGEESAPERKVKQIFSHTEFNDVIIEYYAYQLSGMTLDEFKLPYIKTRFEIKISKADIDTVLPKLYAMEIEDHLIVKLDRWNNQDYQAPYLDLKKVQFDEFEFSSCHYGNGVFERLQVETKIHHLSPLIVVRGFQMKLSDIIKAAKTGDQFEDAQRVRAYVYNLEIDIEPAGKHFAGKKFEIYYVDIGTAGDSVATGLKQGIIRNSAFGMFSFDTSFYHVRNCKEPDPIFMRAVATCLIVNIGEFNKASPTKLLKKNEQLSRWYTLIQQTRSYRGETYTDLEISRTNSAYKYLEQYLQWRENLIADVAQVPLLSLQVQSQNMQILGEAGRDLLRKKEHLETLTTVDKIGSQVRDALKETLGSIADSKIAILQASKAKSESLGNIELKRQQDLLQEIDKSQQLIDHLTEQFDNFAVEVEKETKNFQLGAKFAMDLAYAEMATEAVNMVLSIFSGSFNPVGAMKAARRAATFQRKMKKLVEVMKKIASLIKNRKLLGTMFKKIKSSYKSLKTTVSSFFRRQKSLMKDWIQRNKLSELQGKDLKKLQSIANKVKTGTEFLDSTQDMVSNTVNFLKAERTIRIGYDPGNPTQGVTIGDEPLATVQETVNEFKIRLAKDAAEKGNELSAVDVFKWTIAKEHVTGMIDTTLSDDVPEATNYRTALLKLITTGETRTQASLDQAALETKFAASKYAWDLYFQEAVAAGREISETEEEIRKAVSEINSDSEIQKLAKKKRVGIELDIEWEVLAIKLEMVRLNEEYCNSYFYFHLEKCQADLRIDPSNSLEEVLMMQSMMLYQSNQRLNDLNPAPQTFTERTITMKKVEHCDCLKEFEGFRTTEKTQKVVRDVQLASLYEKARECLDNDGFLFPHQKLPEDETLRKTEHRLINELMEKCADNVVKTVMDKQEFIYKVEVDHPVFKFHERVRVDEVKVILKGAKTDTGVVEVQVETTGVSEDKFDGHCFKFIGEKWLRSLSYYSKESEMSLPGGRARRSVADAQLTALTNSVDDIKKKIGSMGRDKGVVFIDNGDIHRSFSGVFRSPTVFSTWLIKVPKERNPGLELSDLKEIEIKFSGSFVAATAGVSLKCHNQEESEMVFPKDTPSDDEDTDDGAPETTPKPATPKPATPKPATPALLPPPQDTPSDDKNTDNDAPETTPKPATPAPLPPQDTPSDDKNIDNEAPETTPKPATPTPLPPQGEDKILKVTSKGGGKNKNLKGLRMSDKKLDTSKSSADDERKFNQAAFGTKTTAQPTTPLTTTPIPTTTTTTTTTSSTTTTIVAPRKHKKTTHKQKPTSTHKTTARRPSTHKTTARRPTSSSNHHNPTISLGHKSRSKSGRRKRKQKKQQKKKKKKNQNRFTQNISPLYESTNTGIQGNQNKQQQSSNNNNNNVNNVNNNSNNVNNNNNNNQNNKQVKKPSSTNSHEQHYEDYSSPEWPLQNTSQNNHQTKNKNTQQKEQKNKWDPQQQQQQTKNKKTQQKEQKNKWNPQQQQEQEQQLQQQNQFENNKTSQKVSANQPAENTVQFNQKTSQNKVNTKTDLSNNLSNANQKPTSINTHNSTTTTTTSSQQKQPLNNNTSQQSLEMLQNSQQKMAENIKSPEQQKQPLTNSTSQQSLNITQQPALRAGETQQLQHVGRPFNNTAPFALTITSQGMSNQTTSIQTIRDDLDSD